MFISVVIPAYLERENLGDLTKRLLAVLGGLGFNFEVLYVIEGSDGSREFLDNLNDSRVRYIFNPKRLGIAKSLLLGFSRVLPRTDLILTMDA